MWFSRRATPPPSHPSPGSIPFEELGRRSGGLGYVLALQQRQPAVTAWDWEATLERTYSALLQPGAFVVDVGGHSGRHTRVFCGKVQAKKVWVFEPLPQQAAFLEQHFAQQPVQVHRVALSSTTGTAQFVFNQQAPEESGLRRRQYNNEELAQPVTLSVQCERLDDQAQIHRCDFIKIDVEGAELDVLQGGRQFLARHRPLVSIEYGYPAYSVYGREPGDLFDKAQEIGYVVTDLLGQPFLSRSDWLLAVDRYYWDYLLVPQERAAQVWQQLLQFAEPVPVPSVS